MSEHTDTLPLTIRLDRWASYLRNQSGDVTLEDDEPMELSTLLTEAANNVTAPRTWTTP